MARPTKLNKSMLKKIEENVAVGLPEKYIADLLKVNWATWYEWKRKAKIALKKKEEDLTDNEKIYIEFHDHLMSGYAARVKKNLIRVVEDPSPKMSLEWLERFDPKTFGKKVEFDPEDLDKWLRSRFTAETIDIIYTAMENDNETRSTTSEDSGPLTNTETDGEGSLGSVVETVDSEHHTVEIE